MRIEIDVPQIPEPKTVALRDLIDLVLKAHADSARENQCASSGAVVNCGGGLNGIASAILTIGERHAPIAAARAAFLAPVGMYGKWLDAGAFIPGFGNSFFEGGDPKWFGVRDWIASEFPEEWNQLRVRTEVMLSHRPTLHPNAAMYSAIACHLAGVPGGQEALLFILPRLPVWFSL